MIQTEDIVEPQTVACLMCLIDVPGSVSKSPEGTEYVYHFCGAECYEQWRGAQPQESPAPR